MKLPSPRIVWWLIVVPLFILVLVVALKAGQ
jgi:hypothetical protein